MTVFEQLQQWARGAGMGMAQWRIYSSESALSGWFYCELRAEVGMSIKFAVTAVEPTAEQAVSSAIKKWNAVNETRPDRMD